MIPIYYDVSTKTAYYERADASLIIKTNYVPAFKELFDFYLSSGDFLREAIYLMSFDCSRYTTKRGRILVTEVNNFLESYYNKKEL